MIVSADLRPLVDLLGRVLNDEDTKDDYALAGPADA